MGGAFAFDVFLSSSVEDAPVAKALAARLTKDGLQVWFDGPVEGVEKALESSRTLVLFLSASALRSDWVSMVGQTFRFRDPLNKERRFIVLRLDDHVPIPDLSRPTTLNWRADLREVSYGRLVEVCRSGPRAPERPELAETAKPLSLGHTMSVYAVAFSPDGRLALSGSLDATLRIWDVASGECLRVFDRHGDGVVSAAWSPWGDQVLSGSRDSTLRLWDPATGECLRIFEGHAAGVWGVAWGPDGKRALSTSTDHTLRVWNVRSGRCDRVIDGASYGVAFCPDGERAVTGGMDGALRVWDVTSGQCLRTLKGHEGAAFGVAWSPDGQRVLSTSQDRTIRLWAVNPGLCLGVLKAAANSVAWNPAVRGYALTGSDDGTVQVWDVDTGRCLQVLKSSAERVHAVAWSPDGLQALSGSDENTVRLWDIRSGECVRTTKGHADSVHGVAWSPDGAYAVSGSDDGTLQICAMETGHIARALTGHSKSVLCVAWSPDGSRVLSGSLDQTKRVWDVQSGQCLNVIEELASSVRSVAWNPDGRRALTCSDNGFVRVWDVHSGVSSWELHEQLNPARCATWSPDGARVAVGSHTGNIARWDLEERPRWVSPGHSERVRSIAWSPDGAHLLTGSEDKTLQLWNADDGRRLAILEGHTHNVLSVAWSPGGRFALSGSSDATMRLWDLDSFTCLHVFEGHNGSVRSVGFSPDGQLAFSASVNGVMRRWSLNGLLSRKAEARSYTNAKVLLVGDSGAGKTGLSHRLANDGWAPSDSTVGAWATHWQLPVAASEGMDREIWLWDFGGQADQRLIHQLYMDETALAVLVFDPQREDLFETLGQWDRELTRSARRPFQKLLVAGRIDGGRLRVSKEKVQAFAKERGYAGYIETSAKLGDGCSDLKKAILDGIRWEEIPWRSSPRLFKRLKEELVRLKDKGRTLIRLNELRDLLQLKLAPEGARFTDEELKAVVGLLTGPCVVWELSFGNWVLLQPERVNAYAQAVIATLRADPHQLGSILEERVLNGELAYSASLPRLSSDEERIILLAMVQTLVERGLCLRDQDPKGNRATLLIFPAYYGRERPELVGHPAVHASYRFNGFLDEIYSTLVVRLHHADPFLPDGLWRYAADFRTVLGKRLGIKLTRRAEGAGELEVYFDPSVSVDDKVVFSKYVHEHLLAKAQDVERLRQYVCPHCGTPVENRATAMKRLTEGKKDILCVACEQRVPLWDELEEKFASPEIQKRVHELQAQARIVLDAQSKERTLVGEVISTVSLAGQISRELTVSDHGIDMEIELKDDRGEATGKKLYLQLKSGDSHLRRRERDEAEIFPIKDARHADYWMKQAFPVLLVIRNSAGEVRWMEVRDRLKRETENGQKPVKQIVFEGERFDVMSVRRWRDRLLGGEVNPAAG